MQESDLKRRAPWEEIFFREAFFLYEHRAAVYADRRMFFSPLPFKNNLAYSGSSGLDNATLGIYLKWWDSCERAVIREQDRVVALTDFIAGSPLSGINTCAVVDKEGNPRRHSFASPFSDIWNSFRIINTLYDAEKGKSPAFTLEETVAKLRASLTPSASLPVVSG